MPDPNDRVNLDGEFKAKLSIELGLATDVEKRRTLENIIDAVAREFAGGSVLPIVEKQMRATGEAIKRMPQASVASMEKLLKPMRRKGSKNSISPSETHNVQKFAESLADGKDFAHAVPEADLGYVIESGQFHELLPRIYDELSLSGPARDEMQANFDRVDIKGLSSSPAFKKADYKKLRISVKQAKNLYDAVAAKKPFGPDDAQIFHGFFDSLFVQNLDIVGAIKSLPDTWEEYVIAGGFKLGEARKIANAGGHKKGKTFEGAIVEVIRRVGARVSGADAKGVNDYVRDYFMKNTKVLTMNQGPDGKQDKEVISEEKIGEAVIAVFRKMVAGEIAYAGELPQDIASLTPASGTPVPPPPGAAPPQPQEYDLMSAVQHIKSKIGTRLDFGDIQKIARARAGSAADVKLSEKAVNSIAQQIIGSPNPRELVTYELGNAVHLILNSGFPQPQMDALGNEGVGRLLMEKQGYDPYIPESRTRFLTGDKVDEVLQELSDRFAASPPPGGSGGGAGGGSAGGGGSGGGAPPREYSIADAVILIGDETGGMLVPDDVQRIVNNAVDYDPNSMLAKSEVNKIVDEIQNSHNPRDLVPYKLDDALNAISSAGLPADKLNDLGRDEVVKVLKEKAMIPTIDDVSGITFYGSDIDETVQELQTRFAPPPPPPPPPPGGSGGGGGPPSPPPPPKEYSIDEAVAEIAGKVAGKLSDDDIKRVVMKEVNYKADAKVHDSHIDMIAGAIQNNPNPRQSVPYKLDEAVDAVFGAGLPQDELNKMGRDGVKDHLKAHKVLDPDIPGGGIYGTTVDMAIENLRKRFAAAGGGGSGGGGSAGGGGGGSGGGAPPPKYNVDDAVAKLLSEVVISDPSQHLSEADMRGVLLYQTGKLEDAEFDDADIEGVANTLDGTITPKDYVPHGIEDAIVSVKKVVLMSKRKGLKDEDIAQKLRQYAGVAADAPQVLEKDIASVVAELNSKPEGGSGGGAGGGSAGGGGSGGGAPPPGGPDDALAKLPYAIADAVMDVAREVTGVPNYIIEKMLRKKAGVDESAQEIPKGTIKDVVDQLSKDGIPADMMSDTGEHPPVGPASPPAAPKKEKLYGPVDRRPMEPMYFREFVNLVQSGFLGVSVYLEPRDPRAPADSQRKPKTPKTEGEIIVVPEGAIAHAVNWHYFRKDVNTEDDKKQQVREFVRGKGVLDVADITDLLENTMPILYHHAKTKDAETEMFVSEDDFASQCERIPGKKAPLKQLILNYSWLARDGKWTATGRNVVSATFDAAWAADPNKVATYGIVSKFIEWGRNAYNGKTGSPPQEIEDIIKGAEERAAGEKKEKEAKTGRLRRFGRWLAGLAGYGRPKESEQQKLCREFAKQGIPEGLAISLEDMYEKITDSRMKFEPEGTDRNAEKEKIAAAFAESNLLPYATVILENEGSNRIAGLLLGVPDNEVLYTDFQLGREQPKSPQFAVLENQLAVWATDPEIDITQKQEKKELRRLVAAYTDIVPYTKRTRVEGRKKITEVDMGIGDRIKAMWKQLKQEAEKPLPTGGLDQADILVNVCLKSLSIDPLDEYENTFVSDFVAGYISREGAGAFGLDKGKKDDLVDQCRKALESERKKRKGSRKPEPADALPDNYSGNLDAAQASGMVARDFCDEAGNAIPQANIESLIAGIPKKTEKDGSEVVPGDALYNAAIARWKSRDAEAKKTRAEMEAVKDQGSKVIRIFNKDNIPALYALVDAASLEYKTHLNKDCTKITYTGSDEREKKIAEFNLEYHTEISMPHATAVDILLAYTNRKHKDIELMKYDLCFARKGDELQRDLEVAKRELEAVQRKLRDADPGKVRRLQKELERYKAQVKAAEDERDEYKARAEEKERTVATLQRNNEEMHHDEIKSERNRRLISLSKGAVAAAAIITVAAWGYSQIDNVKSYLASRSYNAEVMREMKASAQERTRVFRELNEIFGEDSSPSE